MPASKETDQNARARAELLGETPEAPTPPAEVVAEAQANVELAAAIAAETDEPAEEEVRLHPILSNAEYLAAQERAAKRVEEDARKEAVKHVEQEAYDRMRGKKGLRTGDPRKDELVSLTLDLPEFTDRITINHFAYMHGGTYTVPRHVADSLREIQSRAWDHDNEINGKGIADRARLPRNTLIGANGGVINGPQAA